MLARTRGSGLRLSLAACGGNTVFVVACSLGGVVAVFVISLLPADCGGSFVIGRCLWLRRRGLVSGVLLTYAGAAFSSLDGSLVDMEVLHVTAIAFRKSPAEDCINFSDQAAPCRGIFTDFL